MYVILGATGNTGTRIAETLLAAGKPVTAVGRDAAKLKALADKGAVVATGDLHDTAFLTKIFQGATAVYTLVPPKWDVTDWRAFQLQIETSIGLALAAAGVQKVVNLSSMGANLPEGAGPVSGLYYMEQILNNIPGLSVLHLRPGYFYQNLYGLVGMIQHAGVMAQPIPGDLKFVMTHVKDIADIAAQRLLDLDFSGNSVQFVAGPEDHSFADAAAAISATLGKQVPFVTSSVEDTVNGMAGMGIPASIALGYVDLYKSIENPAYQDGYDRSGNTYIGKISLAEFVEQELKYALA
jgi:uncharacterized protein YbjT (DUF2867 family)